MNRMMIGGIAATLAVATVVTTAVAGVTRSAGNAGAKARTASQRATPIVWTDLDGRGYGPVHLQLAKATVFLFTSTQCPIANRYAPRLYDLHEAYDPKGVRFVMVNSHPLDSLQTLRAYMQGRHFRFPAVKDAGTTLADRLGATHTPSAVVVDPEGRIVYRGRIDDSKESGQVGRRDLAEALDDILAGRPVSVAKTAAFGCVIVRERPVKVAGKPSVTYHADIAPILAKNCVSCHRPGEVGPFSLTSFAEAKVWAQQIKASTERRIMPPWKPLPSHGDFVDARILTPDEVTKIGRWVALGAPEGDPKQRAATAKLIASHIPANSDGWPLQTPDLVLTPVSDYTIPADGNKGKDIYRCFVLPVDFKEDAYVTVTQVKPSNRRVVHHIIVYIDPTGASRRLDAAEPGEGWTNEGGGLPVPNAGWLVGWAPGNRPRVAPPGIATKVPKGAKLVMEVHYHPSGKTEVDRSSIGLTFARETVDKRLTVFPFAQPSLDLPAGKADIEVTSSMVLWDDMTLHAISPHMHMIGREMKVWATKPDGTKLSLVYINDWDFNWQESYAYKQPIKLPRGTKLNLVARYDNSEKNPRNPNRPPKRVTWGEQTTDEMCIAFLGLTRDAEQLTVKPLPWNQAAVRAGSPSAGEPVETARR